MSTWDEKAADAAIEYAKPTMRPVQTVSDHMADAFHEGARWQREAPLTPEGVERAARALNAAGWTCTDGAHEPGDYDDCPYCRGTCTALARAALTAAIGDDDE